MISIIVPVYNVAPYLRSCLNSIAAQTYEDWEMILVDDGSTDESAKICDEYAGQEARVCVVHQENGGPAIARNVGLSMAKGEYVAFIDSDDLLHAQYLEVLLHAIKEQGADVVQSSYVLLSENDRAQYTVERLSQSLPASYQVKEFSGHDAIASMLYQCEMDSSPIKLFRRGVLQEKTFPEQFVAYEDLYAFLDVYARCTKTCWVDVPIYYYFKRMDGTLNTWSLRDERALSVMESVRSWIEKYDSSLLPAVCSRELSMAFNILRLISKEGISKHQPLADTCWAIVQKNRSGALCDAKMRLKNKLGILLSYLGKHLLIKCFSLTI